MKKIIFFLLLNLSLFASNFPNIIINSLRASPIPFNNNTQASIIQNQPITLRNDTNNIDKL